jgi:hypothetical protein
MNPIIRSFLLTAAIGLASLSSKAGCLPPTAADLSLTNITCAGSGTVRVNTITDATATVITDFTDYRFSLHRASDDSIVKGEQLSPVLAGLDSGTYVLHIHQVCASSGVSVDYTKTVRLTGFYTKPVLGFPVVTPPSCTENGKITASATLGYGSYEYCLVDSVTAPLAPMHFVKPRQASNIFADLAPGDYYLRVYDQCTGFVTTKVTVPVGIPTGNPISDITMNDESCDSFELIAQFSRAVPRDANLMWWQFPDGSVDTIKSGTYPGNAAYYMIPKSKVAAYYPATITLYYTNECGIVFHKDIVVRQPKLQLSATMTANGYNCTQGSFSIGKAHLLDTANNNTALGNKTFTQWEWYSVDGGTTWIAYNPSDTVLIDKGTSRNVLYKRCGTIYTVSVSMAGGLSPLSVSLHRITGMHCDGKSGIRWTISSYNGSLNNILVHVVTKPAAQPAIPDFYLETDEVSKYMMNLVPGTYTLQFKDGCDQRDSQTITIAGDKSTMSAWPVFDCGSSRVAIGFKNDAVRNISSSLGFEIKDSTGDVVENGTLYGDYTDTIDDLDPGVYTVRLWLQDYWGQFSTDSVCHQEFTIDANLPKPLALDRSLFAICTNDTASGAVVALPAGGLPAYAYSLYRDSVVAANLVAGPQASNIFSGLAVATKFYVAVTDGCGAGATYSHAFENIKPVIAPSIPYVPCVGDAITLSIQKNPGLFYQWMKNGVDIPGATDSAYAIIPMTISAGGSYQVMITANSCNILSKPMELDPASCGIIIPLPLELLHFNGMLNAQSNAVLRWDIGTPEAGARFEVLYSTNGNDFSTAGVVAQDGRTMSFSFVHQQYTVTAKTFYKLKLVSPDGQAHYSNVLALQGNNGNKSGNTLSVSPVPFSSALNMNYTATQEGSVTISVTDITGRNVRMLQTTVSTGTNNINITNLENLPQGIYLLNVTDSAGNRQSIKVQK